MAKREPHWVKLFLRELERTGNVRISAERAGVDYTSAYQRRKRHAEFAERWEGALGAFAIRQARDERDGEGAPPPLSCAERSPSPSKLREELNARPDGKLIRGSDARWGKRAEERFLTELTVSGSVRRAAKAAGFSTTALYKQRLKNKHFAQAWEAAIETGKARVQSYLVEAATRTFDPDELPIGDEREIPKVSIGEAINIAKMPARDGGRAGKGGWNEEEGGQFVTDEELDAARERIFERLTRIKENIAQQEMVTGRCHNCGQPLSGAPGDSLYQGPMARYFLLGPG